MNQSTRDVTKSLIHAIQWDSPAAGTCGWGTRYLPHHIQDDMNFTCPSNLKFIECNESMTRHVDLLNHMKEYFDDINRSHNLESRSVDLSVNASDREWIESQITEPLDLRTSSGKYDNFYKNLINCIY